MEFALDFQSLFNSLFINFGMFAGLFTVLALLPNFISNDKKFKNEVLLGIFAGLAAALSIRFSVEIMDGVIIDSRVTILTMTALFFSRTTALVAAVPAIIMRLIIGGNGLIIGIIVILFAVAFGMFCKYIVERRIESQVNLKIIAVISLIIALTVPLISVPFIKPDDMHEVLTVMIPAYITQSFISSFVLGALLLTTYKNYYLNWEVGQAHSRVDQIKSAKTEFLAMMSHEIRTPMNGVLGFTEILDQTDLDDYQKHCLKQIKTAGTTMMHLLNDILDFSKIDSGKFSLSNEALNIPENIKSTFEVMQAEGNINSNKMHLEIADDVPEFIYGDSHRIRQIFYNLLGNALKFTENGDIELIISRVDVNKAHTKNTLKKNTNALDKLTPTHKKIRDISDADGILRLIVKDNGIGIPFERQKNIFSAFEQAETGISRKYGGSGLGLAIVKKLIDLMGGTITLDSAVGLGTSFTIDLPYVIPDKDAISSVEKDSSHTPALNENNISSYSGSMQSQKQSAVIGDNRLILIAEDIEMNQELAASMLMQNGFQIQIAGNGQEAVNAVRDGGPFHLVLMDIRMPEMDGIQATEYIRKELKITHEDLPIVALTAHVLGAEIKDCLKAGMNDYISKPIKADLLLKKVAQWALPAGIDSFDSLLSDGSGIDILDNVFFHEETDHQEDHSYATTSMNNFEDDNFVTNPFADKTAEDSPIIDDEMLCQFMDFMGKEKIVKVFEVFKEDVDVRFKKMTESSFEIETVKNEAHALASTSGNLGMMKLSLSCRELVDNLDIDHNGTEKKLDETVDQLHKLADESCEAFTQYVS